MKLFCAVAVALLSQTACAAPIWEVIEEIASLPQGWVKHDAKVSSDAVMDMKIHLKQQDVAAFEQRLLAISTPGNPEYGNHMDTAAIKDMLRPASSTIDVVRDWLYSHGISEGLDFDADWVYVKMTVAQAEELLKAKYENFRDIETGLVSTRALKYSLPSHIKSHINMIHPTTSFALARPQRIAIHDRRPSPAETVNTNIQAAAASCASSVTPACLANLYGYGNYKPTSTPAKMGVAGFLEQWPQKSDLKSFLAKYDPNITSSTTYTCTLINGGLCSTSTNDNNIDEANLDVQYAVGISQKIPVTYYSTGGRPPFQGSGTNTNEPYLDFLNYIMNLTDAQLPTTISISYGDTENTVPQSYANSVCNLFSQVGARGVSILVASGDGGADCDSSGTLQPSFPASCPYVTTVGATYSQSPEKAVTFSGGGFSNYFARPSYQSSAVQTWVNGNYAPSFAGKYNASGRAFPDVAAQGNNFHVYLAGSDSLIGGTSASTPTFASIIDLVSNALLVQGKKPLGFLNPFLYSSTASQGLTDITSGSSTGCSNSGFAAVKGWDPVTGLGTPKFTGLIAAAGTST